jgi:hypothetical protein
VSFIAQHTAFIMKIETSETIDLLLHAYALGSRYDGMSSIFLALFLSAFVGVFWFHFLYITDIRNKNKSNGNSEMDTIAIRNMLRKTSSGDTQSTSYDDDDDDSTTVDTTKRKSFFSRSRLCAKNGGNKQQEVAVAQRKPPSPSEESVTT